MTTLQFSKERKAFSALNALLDAADECRRLYEDAGLPLPQPLARLFGLMDTKADNEDRQQVFQITPPQRPAAPLGADETWIYVPVADALPTSLVLAVLAAEKQAMPPSLLIERIQKYRDDVNKGSIANIGSRLDAEGAICRDDGHWMLSGTRQVPVIAGAHIWGPAGAFQKQELAAHRRVLVEHVLRSCPDGLQIAQLTRTLQESCPWIRPEIPLNKDQVKADIMDLAERGIVKRVGGSGKWKVN